MMILLFLVLYMVIGLLVSEFISNHIEKKSTTSFSDWLSYVLIWPGYFVIFGIFILILLLDESIRYIVRLFGKN